MKTPAMTIVPIALAVSGGTAMRLRAPVNEVAIEP